MDSSRTTHDNPTFNCGSRLQQRGTPPGGIVCDGWRDMPDGSRTCSYCGSLHEEDAIEIMEKYAAGEDGYKYDPTTKNYKLYLNRPDVRNASEGGIKFYGWHVPTELKVQFQAAHTAAHKKFYNS